MRVKASLAAILLPTLVTHAYGEPVDHHGTMVDHKAPALQCLVCHDGIWAISVSSCDRHARQVYGNGHRSQSFLSQPPVHRKKSYASLGEILAEGLELERGNVIGCYTCHDLRNAHITNRMINIREGKTLCGICHKM